MLEPLTSTVLVSGQYGGFSYSYSALFVLSLLLSIFIVLIFAGSKINEPTFDRKNGDYITQMRPKDLASRDEYHRAWIIYVSSLILLILVLSLLGPKPLSFLGIAKAPDAPAALPIFLALLVVGLLPSVPVARELERQFRRFAHERASIPEAARNIVEKLTAAEFEFSVYSKPVLAQSVWTRGVDQSDIASNRGSLLYSWARLGCLLHGLHVMLEVNQENEFDSELFLRYQLEFDNIGLKKKGSRRRRIELQK
jgi:hypothetical protein